MSSYLEVSDNELAEFSKRDPDAFGELVLRYQDRLFRYVRRISYFRNEDVEDIVQETFIKLYRSLNLFDGDLSFSTWAYRIAHNTVIDAIRKKQSRPKTVGFEEEDMTKFLASDINIQIRAEAKDQLKIFRNIIDKMPYKYREVMVLRFLEEKSYEEIMDILEKPKGTVATLVSRGRKMLLEEARKQFHIVAD